MKVQAATRGWLARRKVAELRAELARLAAARAAEKAAARAVIAPWAATFRDRCHFLALRCKPPREAKEANLSLCVIQRYFVSHGQSYPVLPSAEYPHNSHVPRSIHLHCWTICVVSFMSLQMRAHDEQHAKREFTHAQVIVRFSS